MSKEYKIIIDTEQYSGNFEREMCAYVTGIFGECEVGQDLAKFYSPEIKSSEWLESEVKKKPDEHGCHRPVSISPTPGWYNNGRGGHFRDSKEVETYLNRKWPAYLSVEIYSNTIPPQEVIEEIIERAKNFCLNRASIYEKASQYVSENDKKPLTFTGARIVEVITTENELYAYKP
jgi:hypothetical protein